MKYAYSLLIAALVLWSSFSMAQGTAQESKEIDYYLTVEGFFHFLTNGKLVPHGSDGLITQEELNELIGVLLQPGVISEGYNCVESNFGEQENPPIWVLGVDAYSKALQTEVKLDFDDRCFNIFMEYVDDTGRKPKLYYFEAGLTREGTKQVEKFYDRLFEKYGEEALVQP